MLSVYFKSLDIRRAVGVPFLPYEHSPIVILVKIAYFFPFFENLKNVYPFIMWSPKFRLFIYILLQVSVHFFARATCLIVVSTILVKNIVLGLLCISWLRVCKLPLHWSWTCTNDSTHFFVGSLNKYNQAYKPIKNLHTLSLLLKRGHK